MQRSPQEGRAPPVSNPKPSLELMETSSLVTLGVQASPWNDPLALAAMGCPAGRSSAASPDDEGDRVSDDRPLPLPVFAYFLLHPAALAQRLSGDERRVHVVGNS